MTSNYGIKRSLWITWQVTLHHQTPWASWPWLEAFQLLSWWLLLEFPLYQPSSPQKNSSQKGRPKIKMIRSNTRRFFGGDEVHPGFFRLQQIRIDGRKPVGALKTSKKICLKKVMRGHLQRLFFGKIWGPGVQTQLSRCSNTAFAPRLDHFFLGTANLPMRLEVSQKNSRSWRVLLFLLLFWMFFSPKAPRYLGC